MNIQFQNLGFFKIGIIYINFSTNDSTTLFLHSYTANRINLLVNVSMFCNKPLYHPIFYCHTFNKMNIHAFITWLLMIIKSNFVSFKHILTWRKKAINIKNPEGSRIEFSKNSTRVSAHPWVYNVGLYLVRVPLETLRWMHGLIEYTWQQLNGTSFPKYSPESILLQQKILL